MSANPRLNTIVWGWVSKPFGEDEANGTITLNLRFPGQYFDAETGTHYNINRDYNPVTGRYIQSDPIGLDGGVNGYLYTGANSLSHVDLEGLYWEYNIKSMEAFSFLTTVIRPTLYSMGSGYWSEAAEQLLLGTAVHESENFIYRRQNSFSFETNKGGFGVYQIQYNSYITSMAKKNKRDMLDEFRWMEHSDAYNVTNNDPFSTVLARLEYGLVSASLPSTNNLKEQADYWADHYNKGGNLSVKTKDYISDWKRYVDAF